MVERTLDSIKIPGGMISVFLKWAFYRLWTALGIGVGLYGGFIFLLVLIDWSGYPGGLASRISFTGLGTIVVYAVGMVVLGSVIAWYNTRDGDQTFFDRKQLIYQLIATIMILGLFWLYPGIHGATFKVLRSLVS